MEQRELGRRPAGSWEPKALPRRRTGVRTWGSSPAPRATHVRGSVEVLLRSPLMASLM
jgi:hypothetical protein